MYLMTECDDRMGKYLPLRTSCASVIFYRHGPREKYCTFLARLNNLAKSYLTIRPLFFFLFFSILFFLCAFPGLFGACATAYRDFFFTVRYSIKARTCHVIIRIVISCLGIVQLFFN